MGALPEDILFHAKRAYSPNGVASLEEFTEDIRKLTYLRRLLDRYSCGEDLRERLVLNHLILLYNVFDGEKMTRILATFLTEHLQVLKPFLMVLSRWPDRIALMDGTTVLRGDDVPLDGHAVDRVRKCLGQ